MTTELLTGKKHIINRFAQVEVTDEEYLRGSIYTQEQLWVIQNILGEAAVSKSALDLDPEKPLAFIQQESYLKGKIDIIEFMLTNHEASQEELTTRLRDNPPED